MSRVAGAGMAMILLGCPQPPRGAERSESLGERFRRTVLAMEDLLNRYDYPDHLKEKDAKKKAGDFNVESYFTVMKHMSMEPGYRLDYVYHYDWMGGYSVL